MPGAIGREQLSGISNDDPVAVEHPKFTKRGRRKRSLDGRSFPSVPNDASIEEERDSEESWRLSFSLRKKLKDPIAEDVDPAGSRRRRVLAFRCGHRWYAAPKGRRLGFAGTVLSGKHHCRGDFQFGFNLTPGGLEAGLQLGAQFADLLFNGQSSSSLDLCEK